MTPIIQIFNRSDLTSSYFVSPVMANKCNDPFFWLMEFSHLRFDTSKRSKVRLRSKDLRLYTPTVLHNTHKHITTKRLASACGNMITHRHILYLLIPFQWVMTHVCPTAVNTRNNEWVQYIFISLISAGSLADLCKFSRHFWQVTVYADKKCMQGHTAMSAKIRRL
jgi:hypothetical protein